MFWLKYIIYFVSGILKYLKIILNLLFCNSKLEIPIYLLPMITQQLEDTQMHNPPYRLSASKPT